MRVLFILIMAFVITSCAGSPVKLAKMDSEQIKTVTDEQLIICMQYKNYDTDTVYSEAVARGLIAEDDIYYIKKAEIRIGMSETALVASKGYGHKVNRTAGDFGVHKQYVYGTKIGERTFVYVENGKVTSWQD